ncbi:ATP-binding cassette domain-containing protein, partial [bacterium]|nr:ATP-binding cassette domain-containing protein [bacterium]
MIRLEEVYKSYDGAMVLSDINLHIPTGKNFVILGESGVGKSVLLRHIIGLEKPDSGRIYINQ